MEPQHFAYLFAIAVGVVSAGLTGSLWAVAAGEFPRPGHLARADVATPLRAIAVVASAPALLLRLGLWYFEHNPFVALLLLALGLGWSFVQGVFILVAFCGFS